MERKIGFELEYPLVTRHAVVCTVEIALRPETELRSAVRKAHSTIGAITRVARSLDYSVLCMGMQPRTGADPRRKSQKDAYLSFPLRMPGLHYQGGTQ